MQVARCWVSAALLGALVLMSGCADDDDNGGAPEERTGDTGGQDLTLTDAQIVRVLVVANEGEVMLGELGQQRATNSAVRDFSTRMVNEHTAARQRLDPLLQSENLQPEESVISQQLQEEVQRMMEALRDLQGERFDLALMDAQVAVHARTAMVGDALLTPQVRNTALSQELQAQRQTVQTHLQDAAAIQADLFP